MSSVDVPKSNWHISVLQIFKRGETPNQEHIYIMASKASNTAPLNDWEALIAKPESANAKKFADAEPDPFHETRLDTYYGMYPSDAGEKYAFAIVEAANGAPFLMTDVATIQRHKFTSPKDGKAYFEKLKMPMDPKVLFPGYQALMDKLKDVNSLTEEDKLTLSYIKRHGELIQRYKNLQYCKVEGVNFGYSMKPNLFSSRLKKEAITAFFGVWTKWKGANNTHKDRAVKLITSNYAAFQDKFRTLFRSVAEAHNELQPTWMQDYFSHKGGVKAIIDVNMGSMKVGGEGATIKMVKVGKDPIDDNAVGMTGPINEKDIVIAPEPENVLSHIHYYMGMKSNGDIFHSTYADRFEEALVQLEGHVADMTLKASTGGASTPVKESPAPSQAASHANDDVPF
jgi:hypothetical protein